jgi:copper chaperone
MCGCATQPGAATRPETTQAPEGLSLRVEDMTCGHCAATVKGEIESYLPGATAEVDLASKVVTVRGGPTSLRSRLWSRVPATPRAVSDPTDPATKSDALPAGHNSADFRRHSGHQGCPPRASHYPSKGLS